MGLPEPAMANIILDKSIYVSRKHLHRYLAEFQYRYNNSELTDGQRVIAAIKASQGKRLTYSEQVNGA